MKSAVLSLYGVQVYSILVTVTATPFLILHLGAEGYGLIGLYFILQMLLQVVDGGLTGTITKLSAALNRHSQSSVDIFYNSFWHFKKIIKKSIGIIVCVSIFLYLSNFFPKFIESSFTDDTISNCILIMLLCISIRFFSLTDRGFLQGIEKQKSIAVANFISVTLRYPVAVLIAAMLDNDITLFFLFQLVVVFVEILLLRFYSRHYFKKLNILNSGGLQKENEGGQFKRLIAHSNSLWAISIFWVLASQLDKLVLSTAISLEDFGIFSLALVAANLMLTMFIPINQVLMPRFVKLNAKADRSEFVRNALTSIQLYVCVFSVVTMGLIFFGNELLFLWTRNQEISEEASVYLGYLVVGNFIHGVTNIVFITAYARDDLSEYAKRYMFHVSIFLPISIYAAISYREIGVVAVWIASSAAFFIHTALIFLRRFISAKVLLVSSVAALVQLGLTFTAMYFFRSFVTISQYQSFIVLGILLALFTSILGLNCFFLSRFNNLMVRYE